MNIQICLSIYISYTKKLSLCLHIFTNEINQNTRNNECENKEKRKKGNTTTSMHTNNCLSFLSLKRNSLGLGGHDDNDNDNNSQ